MTLVMGLTRVSQVMTRNRNITLKHKTGSSDVMYCKGDLILLCKTEVSVWSVRCIYLTIGLLLTENLANGDEG